MTKPIIVGLDTSANATAVLASAVDLARRYHRKLIVLHAVPDSTQVPAEVLKVAPKDATDTWVRLARESLVRRTADVPPEILQTVDAVAGTPWQVICDAARDNSAGLVVIGTHGRTAIDTILGTTAARVVNHAPCSVFVVRAGGER
jgi:nucleotide-binding universal stress UspA family protein